MAEYSVRVACAMQEFFTPAIPETLLYVGNSQTTFNNHNFHSVFLSLSSSPDSERVRIMPRINTPETRQLFFDTKKSVNVVTPLSVFESRDKKTFDSIFTYLVNRRFCHGLRKAVTGKGLVYYGCPGLILNSNFEPIVVGLSEYTREKMDCYIPVRFILKVSPSVFTSDNLVEKGIISRLIPFYLTHMCDAPVKIDLDDCSQYVVRPVPPRTGVQKTLRNIVCACKQEILNNCRI